MNKYMEVAIKEAYKANKNNEVPVGAVIVKNNKIIAKSHNKKEKTKNVIFHAEIIAIIKACKKNKNWRLNDCEMYVTLKPCKMCCEVIKQARLKKVYYLIENCKTQENINTKIEKIDDIKSEKYKELLKIFFKNKRK